MPDSTGKTPEAVPHPGLRNRISVDQHENRYLISAAPVAQNLNPGFIGSRAKRGFVDVSTRTGAVGGHFASVSFYTVETS
jgi:hypothetical protein